MGNAPPPVMHSLVGPGDRDRARLVVVEPTLRDEERPQRDQCAGGDEAGGGARAEVLEPAKLRRRDGAARRYVTLAADMNSRAEALKTNDQDFKNEVLPIFFVP